MSKSHLMNFGLIFPPTRVILSLLIVLCVSAVEARTVRYLKTDIVENGQKINLAVVYFRPAGKGPFPLLVFNHGSTGTGENPALFKQPFWRNAIGEFFSDRGWMVAFPQRRGRGGSDGNYDEGFGEDRNQGYSCLAEHSLRGAERALEDINGAITALKKFPEIDDRNIIVGGVSRGGALSVAYAGIYPDKVKGVINFVGGWMTNKCPAGPSINKSVFQKGASFRQPTLWLYGNNDPHYSTAHTRWLFEIFKNHGGKGFYAAFDVPNSNGHRLSRYQQVWGKTVEGYLARISSKNRSKFKMENPSVVRKPDSPYIEVPLPIDLVITRPMASLPDVKKMFAGMWFGSSTSNIKHVLVVESLDETGGQAVFALGKNREKGIEKSHWVRLEAVWQGASLAVLLNDGRKAIYQLLKPDQMEMRFYDGNGRQTEQAWLVRSPLVGK